VSHKRLMSHTNASCVKPGEARVTGDEIHALNAAFIWPPSDKNKCAHERREPLWESEYHQLARSDTATMRALAAPIVGALLQPTLSVVTDRLHQESIRN